MAWGAAAAMLVGTIYSANKQDKAAKRQEEALRNSQSQSRAEAEKGKLEIKDAYGKAMDTIDIITPEVIEQFQRGHLTTQSYLTNFTDAANSILDIGADDYKRELLGQQETVKGGGSGFGDVTPNQPEQGTGAGYGLSGAESAIENARFNAAQDITQGRDTARAELQGAAELGRQGLASNFGLARDEITRARDKGFNTLNNAYSDSQGRLGQLNLDTSRLLNQGLQDQRSLLREGRQDVESTLNQSYQDALSSSQQGFDESRQGLQQALASAQGISPGRVTAEYGNLGDFQRMGVKSSELEAALSGAMGPEAQAEAYANFQESAGQKYLRERQEQSLLRNSAATGGLQGGRVLTALQEQAQGIASTDLQRQISNLQALSSRGLQAASHIGSLGTQASSTNAQLSSQASALRGQLSADIQSRMADLSKQTGLSQSELQRTLGDKLAGISSQYTGAESQLRQNTLNQQLQNMQNTTQGQIGLDAQLAQGLTGLGTGAADRLYQSLQQQGLSENQITQVLGGNLAGLETDSSRQMAGNNMQAGGAIGNMRMGVGQQLAGNIGQTRQQQAANMGSLGTNLANLNDRTSTNIANLLQNQMTNKSQLQAGLGTNLGNISVGQGTNTLDFANSLAQASGLRDLASANKVMGITNTLGNLASNVDWGNMGDNSTQQQQPTSQSAIDDETFIRGTSQWGG